MKVIFSRDQFYSQTTCVVSHISRLKVKKVRVLCRTSLLSAGVCPLAVWRARSQTSRRWTSRTPSSSPVYRTGGRSDRCFHSAWKSLGNGLWHGYTLKGSREERQHICEKHRLVRTELCAHEKMSRIPAAKAQQHAAAAATADPLGEKCSDSGSEPNNVSRWSGPPSLNPIPAQGLFTHSLHNLRVQMAEGAARSPDFCWDQHRGAPARHLLCLPLQVPCSCALTRHLWFSHYN